MAITEISVDFSQVESLIDWMQANMTEKAFENAMAGIMRRTGKKVGQILRQDLPKKYVIKKKDVRAATKSPKVTPMSCSVPVQGKRLHIGGGGHGFQVVPPSGLYGWESLHSGPYPVRAKIVTGSTSTLPYRLAETGTPGFRNLGSAKSRQTGRGRRSYSGKGTKLNGLTFARKTSDFHAPIQPVVGIAIPQMPTNRSTEDVQDDLQEYLEKQIEHRCMALMRVGR